MRRRVRRRVTWLVVCLIGIGLLAPSAVSAAEEAQDSVSGVYGYTAVTSTGFKKGGTATVIDNGDSVTISTVLRNVRFKLPLTDIESSIDFPINVTGDKVESSKGLARVKLSADVGIASGDGEVTFTKAPKNWKISGAGEGTTRWGKQGTATVTGFSHGAGWKASDPPPAASAPVRTIHRAVAPLSSSKPEPEPGVVTMAALYFAVLFAIAMMAVETAIFSPGAPSEDVGTLTGSPD